MITFPKPISDAARRAIEGTLDGNVFGPRVGNVRRDFFKRLITLGLVAAASEHGPATITTAGYNAVGRPAVGQAWGDWTVAWRKQASRTFTRAINWAGTWAEATEMAASVGELLGDGYQVYYTVTAAKERDGINREDAGNIMVDSGARVRIIDGGMLPAELLDREVETVVHAFRSSATTVRTLAEYREIATRGKARFSADEWATWLAWAADADTRSEVSYLSQKWAAREDPERAALVLDAAAQRALDARDALATAQDVEDAAALEADGGWGQPDGMLGTTEAERGDLGREAATQGLALDAAATAAAGEPVFTAPAEDAADEDESVCSDGYPEHLEEVVHQDGDGTQWICRRCGAEGYEEAEAVESGAQDGQRPDGCEGCTYLPGPDCGVRVSSSPACAVHGAPGTALIGYHGDPRPL